MTNADIWGKNIILGKAGLGLSCRKQIVSSSDIERVIVLATYWFSNEDLFRNTLVISLNLCIASALKYQHLLRKDVFACTYSEIVLINEDSLWSNQKHFYRSDSQYLVAAFHDIFTRFWKPCTLPVFYCYKRVPCGKRKTLVVDLV